ncbi:MAG: hypothetical protein SOR72_01485 [Hornefia sp.]|nr:hypothetical protein [Hornefia sp.]
MFTVKKTYKLTNYVKEMNLNNARIKVGADPGNPNRIEGVWSPDSKR